MSLRFLYFFLNFFNMIIFKIIAKIFIYTTVLILIIEEILITNIIITVFTLFGIIINTIFFFDILHGSLHY